MAGNFNGPVKYSKAIADAAIEVSKLLNVVIEVDYGGRDRCIFLRIKSGTYYNVSLHTLNNVHISGSYSQNSHDCVNINGMDYYKVKWEKLTLATCIGVNHYWYNQRLYPKFFQLENQNSNLALSKFCSSVYPDCTFSRLIRIKHGNGTPIFVEIPLPNNNIIYFGDYLDAVRQSGVYLKNLTPTECIQRLQKLGVPPTDSAYEKLQRYNWDDYGWLEHTPIYTPTLDFQLILDGDPDELQKFKAQILFHVELMLLIDYIDSNVYISSSQIWP